MIPKDYVMRLIEQLIQAIARMLRIAEKGDYKKALEAGDVCYELLGIPRELAEVASTETLVQLLGNVDKRRLMARVFANEALIYQQGRDPLSAAAKRKAALSLYVSAYREQPTEDDLQAMAALVQHLPDDCLPDEMQGLGLRGTAPAESPSDK
jgi:hypothetical protein